MNPKIYWNHHRSGHAQAAIVYLILLLNPANCANILFYSPFASYSHKIGMWPLVESLAARGHQITFLSPFEARPGGPRLHPNITDYNPKEFSSWFLAADEEISKTIFDARYSLYAKFWTWWIMFPLGIEICEKQLNDPEFMDWMRSSQFDLIILDVLFNDCGYGLASLFNATTMLYSTSTLYPWTTEQFGLQLDTSWLPDTIFPESGDGVSFPIRIWSTLHPLFWYYGRKWYFLPALDAIFAEKFGNVPPSEDLEHETSLMLINTHFTEDYARFLPPFVVPVGGTQCDESGNGKQELPKEIATFLDDRPFVYISFGSYADMYYHPELLETFTQVFRSMPDWKFVLKTKGAGELSFPENVLALKWVPQQQLLGHPKIKAFISHSGLLGTHEATCAGVPIIAMPVFAEQDYNAARLHTMGYGIRLEITTVTKEQVIEAITNITLDKRYAENIRAAARLFRDRPESGTETATWWTEYVLRHRHDHGALSALKPGSMRQTWYERRLLDVWAVIFASLSLVMVMILLGLKLVARFLFRICCSSSNLKSKTAAAAKTKSKTS